MAARKSDQVLVCLFGSAETLTQAGHRPLFKRDDRCHIAFIKYASSG